MVTYPDVTLIDKVAPTIASVASTDPTDCNVTDGTITITASSTAGNAIEYSINGGTTYQSSNVFSGLSAANNPYEIRVRNADGTCIVSDTDITLTDKINPVVTNIVPTNPTNCGINDGEIVITATGGSGTLEYSIDGGTNYQASNTFDNLSPGTYNVFVRYDNVTCQTAYGNNPVILTVPNAPTITNVAFEDPTDCGVKDGKITITTTGGIAPVEYSIDNGANWIANGGVFETLDAAANPYEIKVRNGGGTCEVTGQVVNLTDPVAPTISTVAFTDPTDCGNVDGTITITATSGAGNAIEYSIDGGTIFQSSNIFSGLDASGNVYEIRVRNVGGTCEVSNADINLTDKITPVVTSVVPTNPSNCTTNDGQIIVSATGGSGTLEYSIDGATTWLSSGTFSGLSAGTYNVFVRYNNVTCEVAYAMNSITLTAPSAATITDVQFTDPSNCGVKDGSITVTASGGTGALEYSINGGTDWFTNNGLFQNLDASENTYEIRVRNASDGSCEIVGSSINLTDPVLPIISTVASTDPTDCGVADGTITITANSSAGNPIEFSIDGGTTYQSSNVFSGLDASNNPYEIRVRNSNGTCIVSSADINLTDKVQPAITNVTPANPSNCGVNDGEITIAATGGATTEYSIDGGTNWQANAVFDNLAPGTYNVFVRNTDATCSIPYASNPVILTAPNAPSITTVSQADPTNCGLSNGTITVVATGGVGALKYSRNGGLTWFTNGGLFENLPGGTYEIRVANNDESCVVTFPDVILIDKIAPVIASIASTNPTDCGVTDGTITVNASSGQGSIEYSIDGGGSWQPSNFFAGLSEVNSPYDVRVRNIDGTCEQTGAAQIITDKVQPNVTNVTPTNPTNCGINDGEIQMTATGGATTEYSIDGGLIWQSTGTFDNLAAGTYNLAVRNTDESCFNLYTSNPVILTAPNAPSITNIVTTNPTNCGVVDGTITVTAIDGTAPLEYSRNGGSTWIANNGLFENLPGGSYDIRVRNANGSCEVLGQIVTLTDKVAPTITSVSSNDPTECGVADGSITIIANSSAGNALQYSIDGGTTYQSSNVFSGLSAANNPFEIRVRNTDGTCVENSADINLTDKILPVITAVVPTDPTNCGVNDGTITVTATGVSLEYSIDGGIIWQANDEFTGLTSGTYNVSVRNTDATCQVLYAGNSVVLNAPNSPTVTNVSVTEPTDCGSDDGIITVTATGGTGTYEYSNDGGATYQANNTFPGLDGGTYSIYVRNNDGTCAVYGQLATLTDKISPTIASVVTTNPTDCGLDDGTITITASSAQGSIEYSIDGGATWQPSNVFTALSAINSPYDIRVRNIDGTCLTTAPSEILVAPVQPNITNVVPVNPTNCSSSDGTITITATGATTEYSIDGGLNWKSGNTFNNLSAGTYNIAVRNASGTCEILHTSNPIVLTVPSAPSFVNVASSDPTNCGLVDGTITVTATGGTSPYEYSRDGGSNWVANGGLFTNVPGGSHSLMIRNVDGTCEVLGQTIVLTDKVAPTISAVASSSPTECGVADGTITITASSSAGNSIQYSIDGGTTWDGSGSFTGLSEANSPFEIRVRNVDGTCVVNSPDVIITDKVQPVITAVTDVNPTNCSASDGSITITANGVSLEYSIDGGLNYQVSNEFLNLGAGTYNVYVRNTDGSCVTPDNNNPTILTIPTAPSFVNVAFADPSDCGATDGSITITATGGTGPYEFSRNGGLTWFANGGSFTGLSGGSYDLMVRNADGTCQVTGQTVVLTDKVAPVISAVASTNPTECGLANGTITISASSSVGNALEFSIDNGVNWQASNVFSGLNGDTYEIRVRNAGGTCLVTDPNITLIDKVQPAITLVTPVNPTNCGVNDGSIEITATGASLEYSIDGGTNWQANNDFTGLGAGTYNVFVRNTDETCLTPYASNAVILTVPSAPSITNVTSAEPTDCNVNDGEINITATGGTGTYEYSIDSGDTWLPSGEFENLPGDTYYVFVRNSNGSCVVSGQSVVLTDKVAPVIATTPFTDPTDCGLADGTITINATSSAGNPLQFSINGGTTYQASNIFSGLTGGTYNIRVRNIDGTCFQTTAVTLTDKIQPIITAVTPTNPTNCSANDGIIEIAATGVALEYSIDGGTNWTIGNTFNGLSAGTYDIFVRNLDGSCNTQHSTPIVLTIPTAATITNVAFADPTNCGVKDGSITVTASGGTAPLEYSINGGTDWIANGGLFQSLDALANPYQIMVRNANGTCEVLGQVVNLTDPVAPTISTVTSTNPTDCDVTNGSITITATSSAGNAIEYSIDGGATYQSSNVFNGLDATNNPYGIRVRNVGNTCVVSHPNITLINKIRPVITLVTPVSPTNCDVANGSITIDATGASLEYSIDGGQNWFANAGSFTGLGAGTYNVEVRNTDESCVTTYPSNPVILSIPSAPSITNVSTVDPTNCGVANGEITITAVGGSGSYEYSIDSGDTYFANTGNFANLSGGVYCVFVRNLDGTCIVNGQCVTLTDKVPAVIASVSSTDPTECSVSDGTITILASSSAGNSLEYSINGGTTYQASNVFSALDASNNPYEIRVRNADGTCVVSNTDINLTDKIQPVITAVNTTDPTNCNVVNGEISITATGASLEYSIDGGTNWKVGNTFTGLSAGTYDIFVRNTDGTCNTPWSSNSVVLTVPNAPMITNVSSTDPTNCGVARRYNHSYSNWRNCSFRIL